MPFRIEWLQIQNIIIIMYYCYYDSPFGVHNIEKFHLFKWIQIPNRRKCVCLLCGAWSPLMINECLIIQKRHQKSTPYTSGTGHTFTSKTYANAGYDFIHRERRCSMCVQEFDIFFSPFRMRIAMFWFFACNRSCVPFASRDQQVACFSLEAVVYGVAVTD